jgi:hypothetical protein
MVSVIGYKSIEKENGDEFLVLVVQGGVEPVKSQATGKMYFTGTTKKPSYQLILKGLFFSKIYNKSSLIHFNQKNIQFIVILIRLYHLYKKSSNLVVVITPRLQTRPALFFK